MTTTARHEAPSAVVEAVADVTIVRPLRRLTRDELLPLLGDHSAWLVLDLRSVEASGPAVLVEATIAISLAGRPYGRTCVVLRDRHGEIALPPNIAAAVPAVFTTVGDAQQAKVFSEVGIGSGWYTEADRRANRARPATTPARAVPLRRTRSARQAVARHAAAPTTR